MARILIIDDCESAVLTFSMLLRLDGFEAITAVDARAGIDAALSTFFDVILVDLRLQDRSGVDLVRELKARGLTAPIVIITSFPDIESSFDAGSCGAAGYVEGPLFGEEISEVVRQALAGPYPVLHPSRGPARDARAPSSLAVAGCEISDFGMDRRVHDLMRIVDNEPWLSTAALADRLELSESRLRHIFAASARVPLARFLRERRLQYAAKLLLRSRERVSDISRRLSWDFTRAFRRRFGMSAHEYRSGFGGPHRSS